jgi:uncharacterized membrane protein
MGDPAESIVVMMNKIIKSGEEATMRKSDKQISLALFSKKYSVFIFNSAFDSIRPRNNTKKE